MGTLSPQFGTILPSQTQQLLNTNYLQFNDPAGGGTFAEQYLPAVSYTHLTLPTNREV